MPCTLSSANAKRSASLKIIFSLIKNNLNLHFVLCYTVCVVVFKHYRTNKKLWAQKVYIVLFYKNWWNNWDICSCRTQRNIFDSIDSAQKNFTCHADLLSAADCLVSILLHAESIYVYIIGWVTNVHFRFIV